MSNTALAMDNVLISEIDFDSPEWSWGFFFKQSSEGFIYYHPLGNDELITYQMPKSMIQVIVQVRDAAVDDLRCQLNNLERSKAELMKMTGEEFNNVS